METVMSVMNIWSLMYNKLSMVSIHGYSGYYVTV